jgi:isoquinoline 1-oxidoreductase beta subunit
VIAGDRRARYGELASAAAKLETPTTVTLKDAKQWTIVGKPTRRLDTPEKITGRAQFGLDVKFDGLLTAVVLRSPVFGGRVKSFDATRAKAVPGVRDVVQVRAAWRWSRTTSGRRRRDAMRCRSSGISAPARRSTARRCALSSARWLPRPERSRRRPETWPPRHGPGALEAEYAVPYIAHAPMEPLNCSVRITSGACELWTGTQFQGWTSRWPRRSPDSSPSRSRSTRRSWRRLRPARDAQLGFVREAVHVAKAAGKP